MNSKALENFLIPEVATESVSKENLKNYGQRNCYSCNYGIWG